MKLQKSLMNFNEKPVIPPF